MMMMCIQVLIELYMLYRKTSNCFGLISTMTCLCVQIHNLIWCKRPTQI